MNFLSFMYVAIGGAVGSMARYGLMSLIGRWHNSDFPYGTFVTNILGGFLMGALIAVIAATVPSKAKDFHLLMAVGVLGGFTTFSTFTLDAYMLFERGEAIQALTYIFGSVILSMGGLVAGMWLIRLTG